MNIFIKGFILALLLGFAVGFVPIWWLIALAAGLSGFIFPNDGLKSFLTGFLAMGLLWWLQAWWLSSNNEGLLLTKITDVLKMGSITIYFLTFFIAGLTGGFGYLTGAYARKAFMSEYSNNSRSKYKNKYK
jgi:hypothetical protein